MHRNRIPPGCTTQNENTRPLCSRYDGDSVRSEDDYVLDGQPSIATSAAADAAHQAAHQASHVGSSRAAVWIADQPPPFECPSCPGSPRESIAASIAASEAVSVKTVNDASLRLEHGAVVCLVSNDGELMGVSPSDRTTWRLMPVAFMDATTASGTRLQHFPTDSVFVVTLQVCSSLLAWPSSLRPLPLELVVQFPYAQLHRPGALRARPREHCGCAH